jgi:hypothetical protein
MGLIKEPLEVDFYVDSRPLTKEDEKAFSDYIKADKLRNKKMQTKAGKVPVKSRAKLHAHQ